MHEEDYNGGIVLSSRPLRKNEFFEVRLEKIVTKWIGSIEIGVTTYSPMELAFPCLINSRSDTWVMTGQGVMQNSIAFIYHYGQDLDKLKIGDRVGVMKNDNSVLHFYVNGEDQGEVVTLTEQVYGLVNLYGQAVQATIVDHLKNLRFHHLHGKNVRISNNGLTASRGRVLEIFNDAILIRNRTLQDSGLFKFSIDDDRWFAIVPIISILSNPEIKFNMELLRELLALPIESKYLEEYRDSEIHKNHERDIDLMKTNSLTLSCYTQIETISQNEEFKPVGSVETIPISEFKQQITDDYVEDSCLVNCIYFTYESCQCTIL